MSLRDLHWKLQEAKRFDNPKILLEQYNTSAEITANMIYHIDNDYDEIEDNFIADFGCGTGILGIAADLFGAGHVVGYDIDYDALEIAKENNNHFGTNVDFIQLNIEKTFPLHCGNINNNKMDIFDVVIMNPPFGTKKNIGIDSKFVQIALQYSPVVYSLHKTSTRKYFQKNYESWGCVEMDVVAELKFDLPKTYKFHKKKSLDVAVDLYRFEREEV